MLLQARTLSYQLGEQALALTDAQFFQIDRRWLLSGQDRGTHLRRKVIASVAEDGVFAQLEPSCQNASGYLVCQTDLDLMPALMCTHSARGATQSQAKPAFRRLILAD